MNFSQEALPGPVGQPLRDLEAKLLAYSLSCNCGCEYRATETCVWCGEKFSPRCQLLLDYSIAEFLGPCCGECAKSGYEERLMGVEA
jgi:hypothetical protein